MPGRAIRVGPASPAGASADAASGVALLKGMPGTSASYRWHGERIHYRALGDGPPIVLVHAPDVGACCGEWRRNMEPLAGKHSVFAVDLPGYGLSDIHRTAYDAELYIQFLADFLRVVAGSQARLVGCGLGGSYLVHVANRWPELVDRLILICPAGITPFRAGSLRTTLFRMMRVPGVTAALLGTATTRYSILEHLQNDVYVDEQHAGPEGVDRRYWVSNRPGAEFVECSRLAGLQNVDIREAIGRLRIPVALAWGRHARNPPLTDADLSKQSCPGAELTIFEHSALAPHEEEPVRFNQLAVQFLDARGPK